MTRHLMIVAASAVLLAACGEAPKPVEEKVPVAAFPAGEWEVTSLTEKLRTADGSTPATKHKLGVAEIRKICSPAGPKPSATLFADQGDDCKLDSDYARNGRINMSMQCQRPGRGQVALTLDGKYDETTFEVVAVTGTYFTGSGDYALTQNIKGKRTGDCPAGAAAAG